MTKSSFMYTNCDEIFRVTIPAVRIAVAKELKSRHKMNQIEIAKSLGIAQPAVNKYLGNRYSGRIAKIEKIIKSKKLASAVVRAAAKGDKRGVKQGIDQLASSGLLVKETLKIL